jgi:hypothetical protein
MWKQNLFSNLLVVAILTALAIIIYCKITGKTFIEFVKEIRSLGKDE